MHIHIRTHQVAALIVQKHQTKQFNWRYNNNTRTSAKIDDIYCVQFFCCLFFESEKCADQYRNWNHSSLLVWSAILTHYFIWLRLVFIWILRIFERVLCIYERFLWIFVQILWISYRHFVFICICLYFMNFYKEFVMFARILWIFVQVFPVFHEFLSISSKTSFLSKTSFIFIPLLRIGTLCFCCLIFWHETTSLWDAFCLAPLKSILAI